MNLVFEKIEQVLIAGQSLDIGIAGSFLRLSECAWPVTVVLEKGGRIIGSMGKMLAGDYVEGVDFDAVTIINGSVGQRVGVQISGGGAGSNRVLGEVSVIDGGKFRSLSDSAKAGFIYVSGSAGNYSHVQLWNPAGSLVNLYLEQLVVMPGASGITTVRGNSSALSSTSGSPVSKKIGGVASVAELRFQLNPSVIPTFGVTFATDINSSIVRIAEPILVAPGFGACVIGNGLADSMGVSFEFYEEPL